MGSYSADEIKKILTKEIRSTHPKYLALEYVSHREGSPRIKRYSVAEVVTDYGCYEKTLNALLEVLHKSDCPFVQKYRETVAEVYAASHADELDNYLESAQ